MDAMKILLITTFVYYILGDNGRQIERCGRGLKFVATNHEEGSRVRIMSLHVDLIRKWLVAIDARHNVL